MPEDRVAFIVKVARMYHEQGMRQPEIAERLHVSQSRVSRMLKEATGLGIVRTVVVPPPGVYAELEDTVRDRYGLRDVVVAAPQADDGASLLAALGSAGAAYLDATLVSGERIGISSWSSSLLAVVEAMTPRASASAQSVVQLIGGVGSPDAQVQATRLAERLARVTGGTVSYLTAPGVVSSVAGRDALLGDPYIARVATAWSSLTVALVGIGSVQPSPLLASSGNTLVPEQLSALAELGAVGDVCLNFFDKDGRPVENELHQRVIGIDAQTLLDVPRRIGVAGGPGKLDAIRAAVSGDWVDVLVTDLTTARELAR